MVGWLSVAKAVLPHVADIVSAAGPVFTKRKVADPAAVQPSLLQEQILELQAASEQNNHNIKELAGQLQTTLAALEQGAAATEARVKRAYLFCYAALALSITSLTVAVFAVMGH